MSNVYYSPQDFGLTIVGDVEDHSYDNDYGFNMFVVWANSEGALFYSWDSGCSCPSPFENHDSIYSLDTGTKFEVVASLQSWASDPSDTDVVALIEKIMSE